MRLIAAASSLIGFAIGALAAPPQSVAIVQPVNNASLTVSSPTPTVTFSAQATASSSTQSISSIDFRVNGTSIGSVVGGAANVSLSTQWQPPGPGTYTLTAVASDSSSSTGNTLTSTPVVVTIAGYRVISVTAPTNNAAVPQNSDVVLRSTATMSDGVISKVDFLLNGTVIATANGMPFNQGATISNAPGTYTLTARATASDGVTTFTSAAVNLLVVAPIGSPPTVAITTPSASATLVVGTSVAVTATATANSGGFIPTTAPGGVTFYADGEPIGTDFIAPYTVNWTPTVAKSVTLQAYAVDDRGNGRVSNPFSVTVLASTTPPQVTVASPVQGAVLTSGVATTISAEASAGTGASVAQVQFIATPSGGAGATIGTATSAPFSVSWTPAAAGNYTLTARVTDSNGATATSSPVAITVTAPAPPTVAITAPTPGSTVTSGDLVSISATAAPSAGATVTQVQFLAGSTIVFTDTAAPFGASWFPSTPGNVSLTARVVDSSGATATSAAVPVTVVAGASSVALTAPENGALLPLDTATTLTAAPTPGVGATISSVQFFANGAALGTPDTSAPYTLAWTPALTGDYSLVARVTDSTGSTFSSSAVNVTVVNGVPPTLAVAVSPTASTTVPQGSVRYLVATATAAAGRAIDRVEFYRDGAKVSELRSPPFSYKFVAANASGTASVVARAFDTGGLWREVETRFTQVAAAGAAPSVVLISPAAGTQVVPNSTPPVTLVATAADSDGSVQSVQFFARGEPVGAPDTTPAYSATFTSAVAGSYVLEAVAIDDRGNTGVSAPVTLVAAFPTPTVAISSPSPATTARATPNVPLTINATAQGGGNAAILLVEFILDGVTIGTRTAPTATGGSVYSFQWTPTTAQLGPHVIAVRATDVNGQSATAPVSLNVNVATTVGVPPTVSVSTSPVPAAGLQSVSTVNFIANAVANGANNALSSVEFFLNDLTIGNGAREQATNLYRLVYDFTRFDFTALTPTIDPNTGAVRYALPLYAIARDTNGNQTVSATATLTVNSAISQPPGVQTAALSPTTITQGSQFFASVNFNDFDGTVASLQLFSNGVAPGGAIANPQPGQTVTFTPANAGRFNLYVVATDDTGNTAVSTPPIAVTVTAVNAPLTALTRPANDATVTTVGAPVFLEGTATNNDTAQPPTLAFVATAAGGARTTIPGIRVGTTSTYRALWSPAAADTYTVVTQASLGAATGTSAVSRRVRVTNLVGLAPAVTLGVPANATTAATANLTATATDSDGSVVEVEFFLNRESIGFGTRDQLANTWRLTASFAGVPPGPAELVALARDNAGNLAASPTSLVTVTAAASIAPSVTIAASSTNPAFSRQVQLTANARDADGSVATVQYFQNGTAIGTSGNAGSGYLVNWTPNQSGTFNVWAVATDNTGNTAVAPAIQVTVRRNDPMIEDAAFILQTYQDIANTSAINPLVFADLDARLAAGTLTRADIVESLVDEPGFAPPVNLLALYYALMGQWPTPQSYATLLPGARTNLAAAAGAILNSNEFFAKFGVVPTAALLDNVSGPISAEVFLGRLHQNVGLPAPSALARVQFRNNPTVSPTLGRGYAATGSNLNTALAEFITNTNSTNTAFLQRARAAALYYQLGRPAATVTVEQIATRIAELAPLGSTKAMADALLRDLVYAYRFVTITRHPESVTVAGRSGVLFSVEALGAAPLTYQWLHNGAPVPGATSSLLSLTNVDTSRAGTYTAVVTSPVASATSDPATLIVSTSVARLANISTRGLTGSGADVLIGGFVVSGPGNQPRQMLVRVVGPRLGAAPFNLGGFLADPRLEIYRGAETTPILTNDNWGTQTGGAAAVTALQQATARVGAFALANGSADAAILASLTPGTYTVQAKGPAAGASGIVLIEAYDTTAGAPAGPKASNVSTRGQVGTGNNALVAGFVVNGAVSRRVLIRGVGPSLQSFGLPPALLLANPQLTLTDQVTGRVLRTNDDWGAGEEAAVIVAAGLGAGAFPLLPNSRDAAMIAMLPPGAYTVQLAGAANGTGIGIVEVYDVDP